MSAKEVSESAESSSGEDSERSSASTPEAVNRRRSRASTASPPETRPATPTTAAPEARSATPTPAALETEVRGSMGTGGGEPSAPPPAGVSRGRTPSRPIFQAQRCRLCDRPTVYLTRSGLSDHATVHHAHWYSAKLDRYIPIPEEDLEAKRRLIKDGQAHRKFRVDPADRDEARSRAPSRDTRKAGGNRRPSKPGGRRTSGLVGSPAMGKRRQRSPSTSSSRRVDSRVVVVSQPSCTVTTATMTARDTASGADLAYSQRQETDFAPPAKSTRPEGFPVAGEPLVPYLPPPIEDDTIIGGMDEHGMVPEIVVNLEQEVEDLNTDLLTTDRQSDSPQPTSPSQEAALDSDVVADSQPMDVDQEVLTVVPSTQPDPSQTPLRRSARRYGGRRPGRSQLSDPSTAPAPPPSLWAEDQRPTVGRGILRLRAPPKLDRTPATRRRPPPCSIVPLPQWTIEVPPPVPVEFRADTPILTVNAQDQGNRMPLTPDVFQDTDVDYRPLTGTWGDIVEREERAAAAAAATSAPATSVGAAITSSSAEIPPVTSRDLGRDVRVVIDRLTAVSSSATSTFAETVGVMTIPARAAAITVSAPVMTTASAVALEAPLGGPSSTGIVYPTGYRPLLRLADIAYTVRMSRIEQIDRVVDTLFDRFRTSRSRDQVLLIVQAMFASLGDLGGYLRERVVRAQLSDETAQNVLDDLAGMLDRHRDSSAR